MRFKIITNWILSIAILALLGFSIWYARDQDDKQQQRYQVESEKRALFEKRVLEHHENFHKEQLKLNESLKVYTDTKTQDRFTGEDGTKLTDHLKKCMDDKINDLRNELKKEIDAVANR